MSWLSKFFNRSVSSPSGVEPTSRGFFNFGRTDAGVNVTPDSALKSAAVWACVNYLSRTIAQLPWHVHQPRADGKGSDLVTNHPTDWVISKRPCPDMGSFSWRQAMLGTTVLWGNAYAEIERDNRGAVVALWPIHPERVSVQRDNYGQLFYRISNYVSSNVDLDPADVFHVRGFGDGPVGYSVIAYAAQSVGLTQAAEIFGASFFGNGMNPTGIIEVAKGLSAPALTELRKELSILYAGPTKRYPAILDAGMKWQQISQKPNESQFVETRYMQIEEICRWFGVPPHKIHHLLRSTFNNIEHQSIEVVVDTITPWAKVFEEEADYKLFGQNRFNFFTKMNMNGLMRGDSKSRAEFYQKMRDMGVLTINEIRSLEDMNQIGPEGDVRLVPLNMTTAKTILKEERNPTPDPAAQPQIAAPDQTEDPTTGDGGDAPPPSNRRVSTGLR